MSDDDTTDPQTPWAKSKVDRHPRHGVVLSPAHDTPGKADVRGAFRPEAKAFAKRHGLQHVEIDNRQAPAKRRVATLNAIAAAPDSGPDMCAPLDVVALFCHGYARGLQLGGQLSQLDELADVIAGHSSDRVVVALYACDAGRDRDTDRVDDLDIGPGGDGGVADTLRDMLCQRGRIHCRVDAHATLGHTSRNPFVRRFCGEGSEVGGNGGGWIVRPKSELWGAWVKALRQSDLRLRFPLMDIAAIHAELDEPAVA